MGWRRRLVASMGLPAESWMSALMNDSGIRSATTLSGIGVPSSRVLPSPRTCTTTSVSTLPGPSVSSASIASVCCWATLGYSPLVSGLGRVVMIQVVRTLIRIPASSGGSRRVKVVMPSGSVRHLAERC